MKVALYVGQTDTDNGVVEKAQKENSAECGQGHGLSMRAQTALLDLQAGNGAAGIGIGTGHAGPGVAIGLDLDGRGRRLLSAFTMTVCPESEHPISQSSTVVLT